jgi:hypothetical protein
VSETTFTPGPWAKEQCSRDWEIAPIDAADGALDWNREIAVVISGEADARLIAAAPDLYAAALKMLDTLYGHLDCTHDNVGDEDLCDGCLYKREKARGDAASDMRRAVDKAEGREAK